MATSRLNTWEANSDAGIAFLNPVLNQIGQSSEVLSHYIHKYFIDVAKHFSNLSACVKTGGYLFYIVGNSKFYDTIIPTEEIYAELMKQNGFEDVQIEIVRKRNSKKELLEFLVSARKPF